MWREGIGWTASAAENEIVEGLVRPEVGGRSSSIHRMLSLRSWASDNKVKLYALIILGAAVE